MKLILTTALLASLGTAALANGCGGKFSTFVSGLKSDAVSKGHAAATVDRFFASARVDQSVLKADRSQGVFQKPFTEFARRLISNDRLNRGRSNSKKFNRTFTAMENTYGIPREVILAFWAFETDYGAFQGKTNTLNALVTLAHDCRRPELFRPQIFAALELYENDDFSPTKTTGAWAGEIGMVQMLPRDILENGVDGDGDGHVRLKSSAPDALMSGAKMLNSLGWRKGEPWMTEIRVPDTLDWSQTGLNTKKSVADWAALGVTAAKGSLGPSNLPASVILPQGRKGPAFLTYPNFDVYFEWNQSFTYVLTAAYFATRIDGAPVFNAGQPDKALSGSQMKQLQTKLQNRGHNVGKIDGILGAGTRAAVQAEQQRLGLPADAWPTRDLLNKL